MEHREMNDISGLAALGLPLIAIIKVAGVSLFSLSIRKWVKYSQHSLLLVAKLYPNCNGKLQELPGKTLIMITISSVDCSIVCLCRRI